MHDFFGKIAHPSGQQIIGGDLEVMHPPTEFIVMRFTMMLRMFAVSVMLVFVVFMLMLAMVLVFGMFGMVFAFPPLAFPPLTLGMLTFANFGPAKAFGTFSCFAHMAFEFR